MKIEKEDLELVESLIKIGLKIIFLEDDQKWIYTDFLEANNRDRTHHKLTGQNITHLINQNNITNDRDALMFELNKIPIQQVWMHADIKYMLFTVGY